METKVCCVAVHAEPARLGVQPAGHAQQLGYLEPPESSSTAAAAGNCGRHTHPAGEAATRGWCCVLRSAEQHPARATLQPARLPLLQHSCLLMDAWLQAFQVLVILPPVDPPSPPPSHCVTTTIITTTSVLRACRRQSRLAWRRQVRCRLCQAPWQRQRPSAGAGARMSGPSSGLRHATLPATPNTR